MHIFDSLGNSKCSKYDQSCVIKRSGVFALFAHSHAGDTDVKLPQATGQPSDASAATTQILFNASADSGASKLIGDAEAPRPGDPGHRPSAKEASTQQSGQTSRENKQKALTAAARADALQQRKVSAAGHSLVVAKSTLQPPGSTGDSAPPPAEAVDLMTPDAHADSAPFAMAGPPVDHRGATAC